MYRPQKVASEIQKSLAPDFAQIGWRHGSTVTIIKVDVAADLKNATIWISVYGGDQAAITTELEAQATTLTQKFASKSASKYSPKLSIKQDTSLEYVDYINRLLKS